MKTDNIAVPDAIWTSNVDILSTDECLPVIGGCQVSSILSNLDLGDNNELKLPQQNNDINIQNNYIILKESNDNKNNDKLKTRNGIKSNNNNNKDNFENILYFVCNLCPFLCTKKLKITEHLENAHKNKTIIKLPQLKCPACVNIFFHKMSLRSHLIHDHGVGNSDLSLIIQAVVYYASNKSQINSETNKLKKVDLPSNKTASVNELEKSNNNRNITADVNNSQIIQNEKELKTVNLPKVEMMTENGSVENIFNKMMNQQNNSVMKCIDTKKMQKCVVSTCKVQLNDLDNMNYHIRCHIDTTFKCLECNVMFPLWKQLSSHLWRLHKIDMELYSCDKCDYKSISLAKLNNIHKLIHGNVKAYVCNICKKAFKNSKQLGNHKLSHKTPSEKLTCACEVCCKNFSDKRQLRIHMDVVHKKIKPFLCNYCGYKGSSKSSLKMHIRQHTGEKPFACGVCSYTTSDHNSLRRHKLRHTGQKPYKCTYCSYACIQSSTYKVHLKTKHPGLEKDLMFTCQECQFRSVKKDIYIAHMITIHSQKPNLL